MNCIVKPCLLKNTIKQKICMNVMMFCSFHSRPSSIRRFSGMGRFGVRLLGEAKYLRKDKLPLGYHLIYRAPMQHYVAAANHVSTLSALAITGLAVYVTVYGKEKLGAPFELEHALRTDKEDIKYYAVLFIFLCWSMRYVAMRYALRVYRKDKECIAILEGQIPFTKRQILFEQGQVTKEKPKGILPWKESWYRINDEKVILLEDYFKVPAELHNMLAVKES